MENESKSEELVSARRSRGLTRMTSGPQRHEDAKRSEDGESIVPWWLGGDTLLADRGICTLREKRTGVPEPHSADRLARA